MLPRIPPVVTEFQSVIKDAADNPADIASMNRFAFYERSQNAYAIVQTGRTAALWQYYRQEGRCASLTRMEQSILPSLETHMTETLLIRQHIEEGKISTAHYSPCETYRYALTRVWDETAPKLLFIMLNPSTATELKNDPTIERCERRARALGYGGFRGLQPFCLSRHRSARPQTGKGADRTGQSGHLDEIRPSCRHDPVCMGHPRSLSGHGTCGLQAAGLGRIGIASSWPLPRQSPKTPSLYLLPDSF